MTYDQIEAALAAHPTTPGRIIVGWQLWNELKHDERSRCCLILVGDELIFQNVAIDPFQDVHPLHLEIQ